MTFEKGVPTAVNGKKMKVSDIIRELNRLGGKHGIGIIDIVENRVVGMKSRGVYETPGGTILMEAHRQLEELVLDRATTVSYTHLDVYKRQPTASVVVSMISFVFFFIYPAYIRSSTFFSFVIISSTCSFSITSGGTIRITSAPAVIIDVYKRQPSPCPTSRTAIR